jgi:hypothetical protein
LGESVGLRNATNGERELMTHLTTEKAP